MKYFEEKLKKEIVVLYIDLRKYTDMVDTKLLNNVVEIISEYQSLVTQKIKETFIKDDIIEINYMGDGIIVFIAQPNQNYSQEIQLIRCLFLAKDLKHSLKSFLHQKKKKFLNVDKIDFGIGISQGDIYMDFSKGKNLYIGAALNHAVKIGDAQRTEKKNIGVEKHVFEKLNIPYEKEMQTSTSLENVSYIMIDDRLLETIHFSFPNIQGMLRSIGVG